MQSCTSPANLLCFPALRSPCDVCDSNNIAYTVYNPYRQPQVHSHLSVVYTFAYYTPTYLSAHLLPPLSDSSSVSVCAAYLTVKLIQWANSGGPIGSESESKPIWIYDIGSTELQPELPYWASAPLTYSEYLELITFVSLADGCEITDRQLEPLSRGGVDLSDPSPYLISPLAGARICWLSSVDGAAFKLSGSRPLGAKKIAIYIRRQSVS